MEGREKEGLEIRGGGGGIERRNEVKKEGWERECV